MRKTSVVTLALAGLLAFGAASAYGLILRAGSLVVDAQGSFSPTTLPKHEDAPISLQGSGKAWTVSGELPPIVSTLTIEFDRHGNVETRGLEVCHVGRLKATTVSMARRACPNAIVGEGSGHAVVQFPEQAPIPISSPITLFNGPKKNGDDTVIAHAYTTVPVPTTFIVPIVIERIHKGVYGYRTIAQIPRIAGGYGHPTSGRLTVKRDWTFKGHRYSYLNARCETGHLQARVKVNFKEGTFLTGTFVKACRVRH